MTDLQELYDSFYLKVPSATSMPISYIIALIKPASSKVFKQFRHSYKFVITDNETGDGHFLDEMDIDEIELLALQMAIDYYVGKDLNRLLVMKSLIGTKDFNKLPTKKDELTSVQNVIDKLHFMLEELKSDMNKYSK